MKAYWVVEAYFYQFLISSIPLLEQYFSAGRGSFLPNPLRHGVHDYDHHVSSYATGTVQFIQLRLNDKLQERCLLSPSNFIKLVRSISKVAANGVSGV